ncbi:unnamed protein product [Nippostrongylus brasiliensis]|uniref:Reverse transcriptase domain-containing protein n=1 Tax=Nippostrongylus brasiliensis TaxID=27835 RepID=A0A0N4YL65_NIPBR|nr:unnamed protein product [Nippostrongylus brasiliensis]
MKSRTTAGQERIRPVHLKDVPPVLNNTLARLFTRYLSDCKVLAGKHDIEDRPNGRRRTALRARGLSAIDHIHTEIRLIEVPREYKMSLHLTSIDLKKTFDSVTTKTVIEALCKQGDSTQCVHSELYKGLTIVIAPFFNNACINKKRGHHIAEAVQRLSRNHHANTRKGRHGRSTAGSYTTFVLRMISYS